MAIRKPSLDGFNLLLIAWNFVFTSCKHTGYFRYFGISGNVGLVTWKHREMIVNTKKTSAISPTDLFASELLQEDNLLAEYMAIFHEWALPFVWFLPASSIIFVKFWKRYWSFQTFYFRVHKTICISKQHTHTILKIPEDRYV